jgi:hypothetical protein
VPTNMPSDAIWISDFNHEFTQMAMLHNVARSGPMN